jgi:hypothetical protein
MPYSARHEFKVGEICVFLDEEGDEIREVTVTGVTVPEDGMKAPYALVINDGDGSEWIVEPTELHPPE